MGGGHARIFFKSHEGSVTALAYSANGALVATGSNDSTFVVWSAHETVSICRKEDHSEPISALAFSPDNRILASASQTGEIILWDTETSPSYTLSDAAKCNVHDIGTFKLWLTNAWEEFLGIGASRLHS